MWDGPGRPGRRRAAVPALRLPLPAPTARAPRRRRWRAPTRPAWSAPTSSCCTPTRTRAGRPGARPGWRETERAAGRAVRPSCRPCWSTTSRWCASRPGCCATRSSRSGAAPSAPPTGTAASGAAAVVYGHLHIPRTTWHDGVRFEEVSVGYPREWQRAARAAAAVLRQILPVPEAARDRGDAAAERRSRWRRATTTPESRCSPRRRRRSAARSRSAAREFTTGRALRARRARAARPAAGADPARGRRGEPLLAGRRGRQHHPLRRLPGRPTTSARCRSGCNT